MNVLRAAGLWSALAILLTSCGQNYFVPERPRASLSPSTLCDGQTARLSVEHAPSNTEVEIWLTPYSAGGFKEHVLHPSERGVSIGRTRTDAQGALEFEFQLRPGIVADEREPTEIWLTYSPGIWGKPIAPQVASFQCR